MSEVCRITVYFSDDENPWEYPLALNGRTIERVTFGGVEVEPVRECRAIAIYDMHDEWVYDKCSACDYEWCEDEPNYCPNCGARVRGGGDD